MVEQKPSKLMTRVRFPSPAPEKIFLERPCGSVVEHSLGKGEVAGPIPAMGTTLMTIKFEGVGNGKRQI